MKKLFCILLTVAMLLSAVSAFAATEINWNDLQDKAAELIEKGDYITFEDIQVVMWMPDAFASIELTEEEIEQGYIAYFMPEDEAYGVAVMYVDVDGMSLEDYKSQLTEYGATEIEDLTVNGLSAVGYVLNENDAACIAFETEAGYIFEVSGAPQSDEGFAQVLLLIMSSIQAAE